MDPHLGKKVDVAVMSEPQLGPLFVPARGVVVGPENPDDIGPAGAEEIRARLE